jgi:type I restriction-modification system DNA methylase subunit
MIAPLSVYFKDDEIRNQILQRHTLKYVINMPKDLFQPNAMTNTAVAVFETNRAFDYENDEVLFYDLKEDGFVLSKNK